MYKLGTKAEVLKTIEGRLSHASVLPQLTFTEEEWKNKESRECLWQQIESVLGWHNIIVRSSAINEDTEKASQAGRFESIGNVENREEFFFAVERVIASYDEHDASNQVLVQPMLNDVNICGVAFTLDPNTMGNYYVINYDETGSTSMITSGAGKNNKLLYIFKDWKFMPESVWQKVLCDTLSELEALFGQNNLDVEFAVSKNNDLYIFQVRTLCLHKSVIDPVVQRDVLERIEQKIIRESKKKPFLCGKKPIYGVMPDWNPAEMIGIRPHPLAMSLYREIITDNVWAYQRDNYGYRNLRSFPLMVDLCGLPYIDVRVSFNSFVPADLDEKISEKLVDYYISCLEEDPSKHDKVEFEIVFSCYTLDLRERIQVLKDHGFDDEEISQIIAALRNVTNNIISPQTALWREDYNKTRKCEERYEEIVRSDMSKIEKIYWLLEDCKRYGTLPFAGLARGAFIAVQMLQSMVKKGIISEADYQDFMSDVNTVSSDMNKDYQNLSKEEFIRKYGHLRPGTYDINSKRYDEAPELYFDWDKRRSKAEGKKTMWGGRFRLSLEQMHSLRDALAENGLVVDILELMGFIKDVIEGREYGKFIFTKNLSKAMQLLVEIGEEIGLSAEDCSYANIRIINDLYTSAKDTAQTLLRSIETGKEEYSVTRAISLPPLITKIQDIWAFYYPDTEPNFITLKRTRGEIVLLDGVNDIHIEDKIVLIPRADPGYDWIFSKNIKGFITKYGGANSHMAIRAGELEIPAVIGVGEKRFEEYTKAYVLEIDASVKSVKII